MAMDEHLVLDIIQKMNENRGWKLSESDIREFERGVNPHIEYIFDNTELENTIENFFAYHDTILALAPSAAVSSEWETINQDWHLYIKKVAAKLYYGKPIPGYEVDDIVQTSWLHILKGIGTYHFRCRLETWVYQIVVNTYLGMVRRLSRKPEIIMEDNDIEKICSCQSAYYDPLSTTTHKEETQEINRLIRSCLNSIAANRRRLKQWMQDHPQSGDDMAANALQVILNDMSQHAFAYRYNLPEPTVSRIFQDLISALRTEMK
jgi:RNA polymerase sigma factor (sigma-70 family)